MKNKEAVEILCKINALLEGFMDKKEIIPNTEEIKKFPKAKLTMPSEDDVLFTEDEPQFRFSDGMWIGSDEEVSSEEVLDRITSWLVNFNLGLREWLKVLPYCDFDEEDKDGQDGSAKSSK